LVATGFIVQHAFGSALLASWLEYPSSFAAGPQHALATSQQAAPVEQHF